jgi:thiamine biosynthesis protein ThiS
MKLKINGEEREISAATVAELLAAMELQGQPVAVEVNRKLVPKRDHMTATLKEGDTVELVTLVGGG